MEQRVNALKAAGIDTEYRITNARIGERCCEKNSSNAPESASASASEPMPESSENPTSESGTPAGSALLSENVGNSNTNILIAYFTAPENVNIDGVDAIAGASVVVKDGEKLGNVQYIAQIIQGNSGGDLFHIEAVQQYPLDHGPQLDFAKEEQDQDARPELSTHIDNMDGYDVIFLGYPNWWVDLPQPLYTFLEEYDLSGKTIIPFCPHGGSGFSNTVNTIAESPAVSGADDFTVTSEDAWDWAVNAVDWASENNIINGRDENRFAPSGHATRAEVASILYNYLTRKGGRPFEEIRLWIYASAGAG